MQKPTNPSILDGHADTLQALFLPEKKRPILERSEVGHIDVPRAREGGLAGGFFAIFIPSEEADGSSPSPDPTQTLGVGGVFDRPLGSEVKQERALSLTRFAFDALFDLEREAAGAIQVVRTADELSFAVDDGRLAMILHIEGAEAIGESLAELSELYQRGLRSLGIVWSRPNRFGHGVPFRFPSSPDLGPGLTEAGKSLVAECNKLGILIDVSHLNEKGFWDVAQLSTAPLVATHSGVHALCASSRNLTDKQLDAIGESGGVVGVVYNCDFLRADGRPDADTPIGLIADHVRYIADRIGVGHVALGSDFDGAQMPNDLGDVTGLPRLMDALRGVGFTEEELTRIAKGNWMRVLEETWS